VIEKTMAPDMRRAGLYQRILGEKFDTLDSAVRRLHLLQGHHRLRGRCSISGAEHWLGRALAWILRLPLPARDAEFSFDLLADTDGETWTRHFPGRTMRSRLQQDSESTLVERIGPARPSFALGVVEGTLVMRLLGVEVFGLSWPKRWLPAIRTHESGQGDIYRFEVEARLGRLGLLVAYEGTLDLCSLEAIG
jgi:hypothetical protein